MRRLAVRGLSKGYDGRLAVSDVSFTVDEGEIVCLLGPNGAGKTTIFRVIMGLLTPDKGTVEVNGSVVGQSPEVVHRTIGYLPEVTSLYRDLSVRELATYFADLHDVPFNEGLLDTVGLSDRADQRFGTLSYGLQRRTGLLIALVHDPAVLVMDEMTKGLDPPSAAAVRTLVRSLVEEGRCVLSSTHNLWEAQRVSDRVLILNEGRLVREVDLHQEKGELEPIFMEALGLEGADADSGEDRADRATRKASRNSSGGRPAGSSEDR